MMLGGGLVFDGLIAGVSFASGDQIVVGLWRRTPFGPFVDAMWRRPDGARVLVTREGPHAAFILAHYALDEHLAAPVGGRVCSGEVSFAGGPLALRMALRPARLVSAVLGARPTVLERWDAWSRVEDAGARTVLAPWLGRDVRTRGVTRTGALERYVARGVWWGDADGSADGRSLGPAVGRERPARFGFGEFVRMPAAVRVTSVFDDR